SLRAAICGPIFALERINPGGNVAIREQESKCRFRRVADVGIDPEQMGKMRVGKEIGDAIVARPRDQTVAVAEKEIEPLPGGEKIGFLKTNRTQHVIQKTELP